MSDESGDQVCSLKIMNTEKRKVMALYDNGVLSSWYN